LRHELATLLFSANSRTSALARRGAKPHTFRLTCTLAYTCNGHGAVHAARYQCGPKRSFPSRFAFCVCVKSVHYTTRHQHSSCSCFQLPDACSCHEPVAAPQAWLQAQDEHHRVSIPSTHATASFKLNPCTNFSTPALAACSHGGVMAYEQQPLCASPASHASCVDECSRTPEQCCKQAAWRPKATNPLQCLMHLVQHMRLTSSFNMTGPCPHIDAGKIYLQLPQAVAPNRIACQDTHSQCTRAAGQAADLRTPQTVMLRRCHCSRSNTWLPKRPPALSTSSLRTAWHQQSSCSIRLQPARH
jgi:hypothetical protein